MESEYSNLPIVAFIGEPNVGKSSLLNKIEGGRLAITSDVPGTTRDRQYAVTEWNGMPFMIVDTAGFVKGENEMEASMRQQLEVAINEADVLVLIVDSKSPARALSQDEIKKLRKLTKPIVLAVNKTDSVRKGEDNLADFAYTGIKESYAVSAVTGNGIGDLLDGITTHLKALNLQAEAPQSARGISVSIVGKPNVGKSSLFNAILGQERVVVSSVPGTTRNAIDSFIQVDGTDYTFIDTAGLKRKTHAQEQPDIYAGFQTFKAMRRSDIVVLVLDSITEISKQDQMIAKEILDLEKGLIIVVNKIDLYEGKELALQDYISVHFPQCWMCPVFFVSAKDNTGITEMLKVLPDIYARRNKMVDDETVNEFLKRKMKSTPPKRILDQKIPRVLGLKQVSTNPPAFELYVNHPAAISPHFRKTIENGIIKELDFYGTPVKLSLRGKDKK